MAGKNGGARFGAGRKKGSFAQHTIEAQEAKKMLIDMFRKRQEPIFKALLDKAEDGDVTAIKEVFDRAWGKVTQPISGDDEAPPLRIEFAGDTQKLLDIITK